MRLAQLGARSLWFDEAKTLVIAQAPLERIPSLVRAMEGIPPLYFALLHYWLLPFSDPLLGARLFSAFCGIAAMGVYLPICRRLAGERWRPPFALGCLSSFWIHASQDGRVYALFLLVALAQFYAMLRLRERWTRRWAASYAASTLTGLYLHPHFAFATAAAALAYVVSTPRARAKEWALLHLATALAYVPWLSSLAAQVGLPQTSVLTSPVSARQVAVIFSTFLFDASFVGLGLGAWVTSVGYCAIAVAVFGLLLLARRSGPRLLKTSPGAGLCAFALFAPLPLIRLAEVILRRGLTQPRFMIYASPFLYLWIAATTEGLSGWGRRLMRGCVGAVTLGGLAAYLFSSGVDPRLERLAAAVRSASDSRLPIVHLESFYFPPLRYYYLPERAHYLACDDGYRANWRGWPGYAFMLERERLRHLGPCVFIDPTRRFNGRAIGQSDGASLAAFGCP